MVAPSVKLDLLWGVQLAFCVAVQLGFIAIEDKPRLLT